MRITSLVMQAIALIFIADFVSGLVHWVEDTFWTEETPVVGSWIVKPNVLHHHDGSAFTRNSWLKSSWDLLLAGIVIVGSAAALHLLSWRVWLFVILSVNANQIHKWSHTSQAKVPFLVRLLQRSHLLQGPKHHGAHHRSGKDTAYCVLTEALNPFLDGIGFWQGLDRLVFITRATPRRKGVSSGHA